MPQVFVRLFNGLNKHRTYLIVGAIGVGLLGASYGSGYLVGGRAEARKANQSVTQTVKEIQYVQVRNIEYERELQTALDKSRSNAAALRARLDSRPINSCPVDADVVGVLNEAIDPTANPAGVPAGETTTVTQLTDWSFDAIQQYNEVSLRYNKLIDWVEENLIDAAAVH